MGLFDIFKKKTYYFDKNIAPSCSYCQFGKRTKDGGKILCEKQGLMEETQSCKQFIYAPLKRIPNKQLKIEGALTEEEMYLELPPEIIEELALPEMPEDMLAPEVPDALKAPEAPKEIKNSEVLDILKQTESQNQETAPETPDVPDVPDVPAVPDAPEVPDVPDVPDIPDIPAPSVPDISEGF
ncbi:MAG: hypothetical protein IJJ69_14690 [Oscillospiraceae bacterium]|nr:hypothetical protein [Oscillospiraceae bacterium]